MIDIARFLLPFFTPLPVSLFLFIIGLFFIFFRFRRLAIMCVSIGIGILLFFGYGIMTNQQLYQLERQQKKFVLEKYKLDIRSQIKYVVILGSGLVSDQMLPDSARISGASLFRLVEGISIQRQIPDSKLIVSGGIYKDQEPDALKVSRVALNLGMKIDNLIVEDRPKDTYDEAKLLAPLLGGDPFVLVTSASHMERAMNVFQDFGTHPLPAPTDYIFKSKPETFSESLVPSCNNLAISNRIIYEWLGRLWTRLKPNLEEYLTRFKEFYEKSRK